MKTRLSLHELMLALAGSSPEPSGPVLTGARPNFRPERRQAHKKHRWGNNVPHQGKRECARRRGGQDWMDYLAADRIRRGLPVSWLYQRAQS